MTSLTQLQEVVSALPCIFADDAGLTTVDFPVTAADDLCLETGFPSQYSTVTSVRKDIQRDDMNRFGMLATRELHFRQSGGEHSYVANAESTGFASGALLAYWDGVFLKRVESQFSSNTVDFVTNPDAIDTLSAKIGGDQKKVWWKTADYIYGIANSLLTAGGNFSAAKTLIEVSGSTNTWKIEEDSLVSVGDYIYGMYGKVMDIFDTVTVSDQLQNMIATLQITPPNGSAVSLTIPCRGRNGVYVVKQGMVLWYQLFPAELCGNSNFDLCFFAKADTTISCTISANESAGSDDPATPSSKEVVSSRYYPIMINVKESSDD